MPFKNPTSEEARASRRRHYNKNKKQYMLRNVKYNKAMREYIDGVKNVPCLDCEVKYPSFVMDFHHRDPKDKVGNIGNLVRRGSWKKLKEEIEKCVIICANCHRMRTHG